MTSSLNHETTVEVVHSVIPKPKSKAVELLEFTLVVIVLLVLRLFMGLNASMDLFCITGIIPLLMWLGKILSK
jgi:hypothetical protein